MAKIQNVRPLVYDALLNVPATRGDDFLLILEVLKNFVTETMSLEAVFKHHVELGIPSLASIIRIRRFIQSQDPTLVNAAAQELRAKEEAEFRAYALNNK